MVITDITVSLDFNVVSTLAKQNKYQALEVEKIRYVAFNSSHSDSFGFLGEQL